MEESQNSSQEKAACLQEHREHGEHKARVGPTTKKLGMVNEGQTQGARKGT